MGRYDSFGGPTIDSLCAVGLVVSAVRAPDGTVALVFGALAAFFVLCMAVLAFVPPQERSRSR